MFGQPSGTTQQSSMGFGGGSTVFGQPQTSMPLTTGTSTGGLFGGQPQQQQQTGMTSTFGLFQQPQQQISTLSKDSVR